MELENKIDIDVHREMLDKYLDVKMTDEQWIALAWNIEQKLEDASYRFAEELWQDIDYLVEEDKKYED